MLSLIFLFSSFIFIWRIFLFKSILESSKNKKKEDKEIVSTSKKEDQKNLLKPQKKEQKKSAKEVKMEDPKKFSKEVKNDEVKITLKDIISAGIIFYLIGILDLVTLPLTLFTFLGLWRISKTLKAYYVK